MRWIFLLVFSLNLIYIGWQLSVPSDDLYTGVKALKNVPPIVLLSEVRQAEQLALLETVQAETSKNEGAEQEKTATVDVVPVVSDVMADGDAGARAEKSVENANVEAGLAVKASVDAPVNVSVKTEAVEVEPKKVKVVAASEAGKPVPVIAQAMTSCFTLGPFRDLDKLRSFTREIKSYVVETDFRGREETEQSLYWVYVEPEKNRKKAIATGKRLKAKKIKDFYIIRDGEKINGLSLGHFRSKEGAYGLAKKVRKLGFGVIVEPVFKTYTVYWLDYKLAENTVIPQKVFDTYLKSTKKNKISRLTRACQI